MAKCIMVQGTMSGAGKSLLVTALCRIFKQDGYRVAPFKSQNMALNSFITKDGLEMGRAQVAQAQAAGLEPDVRMNPILLKPSSDTGSQLIVGGKVRGDYKAVNYFKMKKTLIPDIMEAYNGLGAENDIIVIEGAGSPAEINLKSDDIVNMGMAKLVDAPVLLVGDIDRGGVFAQLYGTVELLEEDEKERIVGLVINKFRGDVEILKPGLTMLEEKTKKPIAGVVPYTYADIDDEDSLAPRLQQTAKHRLIDIAVIRVPRISNFTDFSPLDRHEALGVRYVNRADQLGQPDMVIVPGSKSTMEDLRWMRENGLESAVKHLAASGVPVLGVCGGYQMLGENMEDPEGVEGGGSMRGMGLLPCETVFLPQKVRTQVEATVLADAFDGAEITGYEIHMGHTAIVKGCPEMQDEVQPFCRLQDGREEGYVCGNVCGTYLHGLFDSGNLTEALAAYLLRRKGMEDVQVKVESHEDYQQRQYDILADNVRSNLDMDLIYKAMGLPGKKTI